MGKNPDRKRQEFEATALPHMDALYTTAMYLSRDPDDAADLLQDTLLRAYRSWHLFVVGTNCRAWLITILYNAFRNSYRARKRRPVTVAAEVDSLADCRAGVAGSSNDPAEIVTSQSLDQEVQSALDKLPDAFREAVVLVDLQELSYEEAAQAIDCPIGTVRSRLSRGRQMLYGALEPYARKEGSLRSK